MVTSSKLIYESNVQYELFGLLLLTLWEFQIVGFEIPQKRLFTLIGHLNNFGLNSRRKPHVEQYVQVYRYQIYLKENVQKNIKS